MPELRPAALERLARDVAAVATLIGRRRVESGGVSVFAWSRDGQLACPYCRDAVDPASPDARACAACSTLHHAACLSEAGACTIFGCSASRSRGQERSKA